MASVSIVYRKDKINKKGEAPIHFRLIKNRKVSYISSGLMIPPDHWDDKNNRIRSKHMNSARLNSFLTNKFAELQDQVYEHETISKSLTTKQLKTKIYGRKPDEFFPYAEKALQNYFKQGQIRTFYRNTAVINKLKDYANNPNLTFQDIDLDYLNKYEEHLKDKHKNCINTILKDFKFLRKLYKDAVREDIIEYSNDPFIKYKMKSEKTQRMYLTEDELSKFEAVKTTPGTKMEVHKDMFVFASYVGGLRVSDVLKLRWIEFDGKHLNLTIKKTKEQLSILVPNKAIEILKKYQLEKDDPTAYIFNCLPADLNLNDPVALDYHIVKATAYVNKNLNILKGKAEIEKRISFHISRHTWATRALRKGISIDKVSKLLGHSELKVTQIYAKIVSSELDKAMEAFND